jgi:hypothetical protein
MIRNDHRQFVLPEVFYDQIPAFGYRSFHQANPKLAFHDILGDGLGIGNADFKIDIRSHSDQTGQNIRYHIFPDGQSSPNLHFPMIIIRNIVDRLFYIQSHIKHLANIIIQYCSGFG